MVNNKKNIETFKKMCELALQSKTMCNVKIDVDFDKSTKYEDPKPPKFICQTELEIQDKCDIQCNHCKEYFGGLQEQIDFDNYVKIEAICFAEWILIKPYTPYGDSNGSRWTDKENIYTSKDLYEIYQKNITDTATACR